jgi:hypothetical protein
VVRPDTGAQFQWHACIRTLLVVFSSGGCSFEYIFFHTEWCACGRMTFHWNGAATTKPRQVTVLLHPLQVGSLPLLWRDWSRREHRRACMQLVRHQRIEVNQSPSAATSPPRAGVILSRAQRAHSRLCWQERLARNARPPTVGQVTIKQIAHPSNFGCFAWDGEDLALCSPASGYILLGHLRCSEW